MRDYETKVIVLEKYIQRTSKASSECNCNGKKGAKIAKPKVPSSPSKVKGAPGRESSVSNGYIVRQSSRDSVRSAGPERPASRAQSGRKSNFLDSLSSGQLKELRSVFDDIDADNSGHLSKRELRQCFRHLDLRVSDDEIDTVMHQMDTDTNGKISFEEFATVMARTYYKKHSKEDLIDAFK